MSYQTTLDESRRGKKPSPSEGVRQGISGFLHDAMTLAELQFRLLGLDVSEATGRAILPLGLLAVGGVLGLATLPLLLIALAQGLEYGLGWPPPLATLTAVAVGLLVAGALAAFAYFKLRNAFAPLARSRNELQNNLNWLKDSLARERRSSEAPAAPNYPPVRPR